MLQGPDGALYGSTVCGGSNQVGTVFRLTTNGSDYAVLHHFNPVGYDGAFPYGRLVQASNGLLYGTTASFSRYTNGGALVSYRPEIIYRLNPNGNEFSIVHQFATNGSEGRNPHGLILGQNGMLYGLNGTNGTTNGLFCVNLDGSGFRAWGAPPYSGSRAHMNTLQQGTNGLFCGANSYNTSSTKTEVLFAIGTNAASYTVWHTFATNGIDGRDPDTQLLRGLNNAFYGVTATGGTNGAGTVFTIQGDGSGYTTLYHFKTNNTDGRGPIDSLAQGTDGTLYGVTQRGGASDDGTVYALQPDGTSYRQLLQFNSYAAEGQMPAGAPTPDGAGALFGATYRGGTGNQGTLFKIDTTGTNYSVAAPFWRPRRRPMAVRSIAARSGSGMVWHHLRRRQQRQRHNFPPQCQRQRLYPAL